jgi:hypothetical protein
MKLGTATNFLSAATSAATGKEIGGCPELHLDRRTAAGVAIATLLDPAATLAQSRKPRVPPGLDPGGVAVAIADTAGIAYTDPWIARRLARDGEGELIGWDFVDNDRRPFAERAASRVTALAELLLAEAGNVRLVPFRTRLETIPLGRLMVSTGQGPARALLLLASSNRREDWAAFAEAAAHFRHVLTIVPAGGAAYPAGLGLDTLLVATACTPLGGPLAAAPFPPSDLAVPAADAAIAAARIAARAVRLGAAEDALAGAALRQRIVQLAKPLPDPGQAVPRHGWISD